MCFAPSQLPKVVRTPSALYILTWKCASRHNGVQFFTHLASWLRTRRFSEPTFRPSGAPNHWKNTVFRDFPTFSRICIFFLLTLSLLLFFLLIFLFSLPLPCSAFHLSILSEVWLLNFLRLFFGSCIEARHLVFFFFLRFLRFCSQLGPSPVARIAAWPGCAKLWDRHGSNSEREVAFRKISEHCKVLTLEEFRSLAPFLENVIKVFMFPRLWQFVRLRPG